MFTHLYQRQYFKEAEVRVYGGEIVLALEHLHKVREGPGFWLLSGDCSEPNEGLPVSGVAWAGTLKGLLALASGHETALLGRVFCSRIFWKGFSSNRN